jgi:cell division protein FtsB
MSSPALALRARVPRLAGAALERARLSVVPRRRRRRSNPVPFLLVVSMLAVGGIVGLLLFNTSMQQASFAATSLQNQADNLVAQQQTLEMQLDHLRDPQVIALRAQRMGMVLPTSPAVLDLSTGKVLGDPTPATRLDRLRLLAPPPVKPAVLDPAAHVTIVETTGGHHHRHDGATTKSSDNTGHGSRHQGRNAGRQGTRQGSHHTAAH